MAGFTEINHVSIGFSELSVVLGLYLFFFMLYQALVNNSC